MFAKKAMALALASAASIGLVARNEHHQGRTRYPAGWRNVGKRSYRPHQGAREVARRLRHAERDRAKQLARGELVGGGARVSRRGRIV